MAPAPGQILAVVGMTREAKILGETPVIVGGGDAAALAARVEQVLAKGAAGIVSFGICGALDPALKLGDLVVGRAVMSGRERYEADPAWVERLISALGDAAAGDFASAEKPVGSVAEKAALRSRSGAIATDLESETVARLAKWFGAPFAIVRAVSDAADRALPPAAQVGLGADGRPALGPVLRSLRDNPWQIGALIRTALETEDAFHALERARHLLGPRLGGLDVG